MGYGRPRTGVQGGYCGWGRVGGATSTGEVRRPVVHEPASALEQVRAPIGCLDPVLDHVREGRLDDLPRMIRLLRVDSDTLHERLMILSNRNDRSELWSTVRVAGFPARPLDSRT